MHLEEFSGSDDDGPFIYRIWKCCNKEWGRKFYPSSTLEDYSWTPVCPNCGGFDGTLFFS